MTVGLGLALGRPAVADPDVLLQEARAAERAGDPAAEHAACTQLLAETTQGRGARVCERRLARLALRRDADGSFDGIAALGAVRRSRDTQPVEAARAQVAALVEDADVAAQVRDEAALWLAEEALDERGDAADALQWTTPLWEKLREEPASTTRSAAADLHGRALLASGDVAGARAVDAAAAPVRSSVPREGLPLALAERRRGHLQAASWLSLVAFGGLAAPLAGATLRSGPRPTPRGLVPLAVACLGAGALAAAQDRATLPVFGVLLIVFGCVHVLAAGALARPRSTALRLLVRALTALATLGGAFLVLEGFSLLDGVGL